MTTVRWLADDSDEYVKGTLLQFITRGVDVFGVVVLPSLRIGLIDYAKLRVGEGDPFPEDSA